MKARIKATGEIVEVINYSKHSHCIEYGGCNSSGEYETKNLDEVELIVDNAPQIDWEQRKYEIAKDVVVAFFTNPNKEVWNMAGDAQAKLATIVANNLIEKLKGGVERSNPNQADSCDEDAVFMSTFESIIKYLQQN